MPNNKKKFKSRELFYHACKKIIFSGLKKMPTRPSPQSLRDISMEVTTNQGRPGLFKGG